MKLELITDDAPVRILNHYPITLPELQALIQPSPLEVLHRSQE